MSDAPLLALRGNTHTSKGPVAVVASTIEQISTNHETATHQHNLTPATFQ